jgi:hypothetical protein
MKPIDFILFDGGSSPYTPIYLIKEAMEKDIEIHTCNGKLVILSYYYDEKRGRMIIDVEEL